MSIRIMSRIVNICPSVSEKSVEAAIKKLMDEGYIIKYGLGKIPFMPKLFDPPICLKSFV